MADKLRALLSGLGVPAKLLGKAQKVIYVLCVIWAASIIRDLSRSDVQFDFAIYEKNPKTGEVHVGRVKTSKSSPRATKKNTIILAIDDELTKQVVFQRDLADVLGMGIGASVGVNQTVLGKMGVSVGVSISF